ASPDRNVGGGDVQAPPGGVGQELPALDRDGLGQVEGAGQLVPIPFRAREDGPGGDGVERVIPRRSVIRGAVADDSELARGVAATVHPVEGGGGGGGLLNVRG